MKTVGGKAPLRYSLNYKADGISIDPNKGTVSIDSKPGEGSRFTVSLPLCNPNEDDAHAALA